MRYTHYDETIKRWVVKSEEKADGETIGFCVKQEPKEISGINGDVVRLPLASVLVYGEAIDRLAELENAADVVEVRHGKWIEIDSDLGWVDGKCSVCGDVNCFDDYGFSPYCPNCGAKMDGERKEQG